jgi:hypothetical protein
MNSSAILPTAPPTITGLIDVAVDEDSALAVDVAVADDFAVAVASAATVDAAVGFSVDVGATSLGCDTKQSAAVDAPVVENVIKSLYIDFVRSAPAVHIVVFEVIVLRVATADCALFWQSCLTVTPLLQLYTF